MTTAAVTCRETGSTGTGAIRQAVLVFGSAQLASRLRDLFRRSRWDLEWPGDWEAASEILERNEFPVVICEGDWRRITDRTSRLLNPPVVIAIDDHPGPETCAEAIDRGVLYLDGRNMRPSLLFPLLNHAWRIRNQD